VEVVALTVRDDRLEVLLVRRADEPDRGRWALPGGFVQDGEDLATAAARELAEEAGVDQLAAHLEQLATYGSPDRDPRGRVVTVAYLAFAPAPLLIRVAGGTRTGPDPTVAPGAGTLRPDPTGGPAGGTATTGRDPESGPARWFAVADLEAVPGTRRLAFDHDAILADGVERARAKLEYSALGTAFCAEPFTAAELRRVYEAVWGVPLDPRNFWRKVSSTPGLLVPVPGRSVPGPTGGRPAARFRRGRATMLHPPILRPQPGAEIG
jgi:8-oxo-dGTP diphosphatase